MQSVRAGAHNFYADPKTRKWKASILPYIVQACAGRKPTELPLAIVKLRYFFACPKYTSKEVRRMIENGGVVPYIGQCDITDNLAKGLVDTCAGHVFANDKLIWRMCDVEKLYGKEDAMYIEFEETPDVVMIDGKIGDGSPPRDNSFL